MNPLSADLQDNSGVYELIDFDYALPEALIAQHPPARRRDARLLVVGDAGGTLEDRCIPDLPGQLRAGDVLVLNDTRVIPARLHGRKASGGVVEVLIERVVDATHAVAHLRASKSPKPGTVLKIDGGGTLVVLGREEVLFELRVEGDDSIEALLSRAGHIPLPPYIARDDDTADGERYQTVYAERPGAVAAPTAGLHFDQALLDAIAARGVDIVRVTLHVGAGTFQPVRGEDIDGHVMHAERFAVPDDTCECIERARARGGRVVAVGTTVVRTLEAAAAEGGLRAMAGETRLFIRPGYRFRVVDALLTNFHLPRSTLLMLACAFGGYDPVMAAYRHAVAHGYRFFSYGDAMWLQRAT